MKRSVLALALAMSACASAPVAPPPSAVAPTIPFDEKIAWVLRLEDERVLRDPAPPVVPPPPPAQVTSRSPAPPPPPPPAPPPTPDLVRLLSDGEARIRRRAALAIGRVGLGEGVAPLVERLGDPDTEVRQMAAFALGLIGDPSARTALASALSDPEPIVKGSAAEALGLIGDRSDAGTIAGMASEVLKSGGFGERPADEDDLRRDTSAGAFRLAMVALARLKAYEPLAAVVLDASGAPRVRWWPVAFALERTEDPRARTALRALATDTHLHTRALAIKGLGTLRDGASVPLLLKALVSGERTVAIEAIRAVARIGDRSAAPALLKVVTDARNDLQIRLETVTALGGIGGEGTSEVLVDLLTDPQPALRAEVLRALAKIDAEGFVFVLSGLDPDPHWNVRAALASVLGTLSPEAGLPRLRLMLDDQDQRVIPAVLTSLVKLGAPDAAALALARLEADDPVVRAAAATALGQLKAPSGVAALTSTYRAAQRDPIYVARAAALTALSAYGAEAVPVLAEALKDPDWAVRVRAAELLRQIDPATDAFLRIRPAPARHPREYFASKRLTEPQVSTHVYLETDRGSVQIELAVLDAPLNVDSFITLARKGYYNGTTIHRVVPNFVVQDGDPRGDGEGGPGYTLRDELSQTPFGRGVVGVALDWKDTGGSQFFITYSPQPHLDARYTVIGRVVSGMDVVDALQPWDAIRSIRVWDGKN